MSNAHGLALSAIDFTKDGLASLKAWHGKRPDLNGLLKSERWVSIDNPMIGIVSCELTAHDRATSIASLASDSKQANPVCLFVAEQVFPGQLVSPNGAGGLLISSLNVPEEVDAEFNAWCSEEHVTHLSQVPGVLSARRYKTSTGLQRYVNVYHLSSPEIQASADWKKATDTPWSTRLRPLFKDKLRIVARAAD